MDWLLQPRLKYIVLSLFVLSLMFFYVEKESVQDESAYLAEYVGLLDTSRKSFEKKIGKRISDEDWGRFFYGGSLSTGKLRSLRKIHPAITDLAFYNKHGKSIGQNNLLVRSSKLRKYVRRAQRAKSQQEFITGRGWFVLYPVYDYNNKLLGFTLFQWQLPRYRDDSVVFVANQARSRVVMNPPDHFSRPERTRILSVMQEEFDAEGGVAPVDLVANEWNVSWHYQPRRNMYIGIVAKGRPITRLGGFYALSFSSFALILFLLIQNPAVLSYFAQEEKREKLENIIAKQKEALDNLQGRFREVKRAYRQADDLSDREKTIAGRVVEEYERDRAAGAVDSFFSYDDEAIRAEPRGREIELKPLKREFIFLDPADSSWKAQIKADRLVPPERTEEPLEEPIGDISGEDQAKLDEARGRTFTPEVVRLIKDISTPDDKEDLLKHIGVFESMYEDIQIDSFLTYLNEVYFDEVTVPEVENLLGLLGNHLRADGMALLKFNPYLGCYETLFLRGLSDELKVSLFILPDDPVLAARKHENVFLKVNGEQKDDIFYTKRFTPEALEKTQSIWMLSLHDFYFDGFVLAFHESDEGEVLSKSLQPEQLTRYMQQMAPALKYFFMEKFAYNTGDQNVEIIKELKSVTNNGQSSALVIDISGQQPVTDADFGEIRASLQSVLKPNERIVFNTPRRILGMLVETPAEDFLEVIEQHLVNFEHKSYEYPNLGKSFYTYI